MTARSLFARALAAAAAVGIAIAAPATGAGAATTPPTPVVSIAPIGVTVDLGATPVVTIGATPTSGVQATVPVDGHGTVTIGRPTVPAAAAPVLGRAAPAAAPLLGVLPTTDRLVDADVALHVCVALALLDGQAPLGCAIPAGSATPSLADALARVGVCARAAVLAAGPVTPCGAPASGATGSDDAAAPPSLVGVDIDAQVCTAATVLGLVDPSRCSDAGDPATASDTSDDAGTDDGAGTTGGADSTTVDSGVDVCFGLAVVTGRDTDRCADPATVGNGTGATPLGLTETSGGAGSGDVGSTNGSGGSLAFTGAETLMLTMAGLGSVATGLVLRRSTRMGRAG